MTSASRIFVAIHNESAKGTPGEDDAVVFCEGRQNQCDFRVCGSFQKCDDPLNIVR